MEQIDIAGTAKAEQERRRNVATVDPIVYVNDEWEDRPPMTEEHKRELSNALQAHGVKQIRVVYEDPKGVA
jgi:hypothetical protein